MAVTVSEILNFNDQTGSQSSYTSATFSPGSSDLIVVSIVHNGASTTVPTSVQDSLSNSYTKLEDDSRTSAVSGSLWGFYYSAAQTNITLSVTFGAVVNCRQVKIVRIVGVGSAAIDSASAGGVSGSAHISTAGLSTTAAPGSMTPSNADLIIALCGYAMETPITTPPAGYTIIGSDLHAATRHISTSLYYKEQGATGAENPTWTTPNIEHVQMQVAFQPVASGTSDFRTQDFRIVGDPPVAPLYTQLQTHFLTAVTRSTTW